VQIQSDSIVTLAIVNCPNLQSLHVKSSSLETLELNGEHKSLQAIDLRYPFKREKKPEKE